MNWKTLLSSAGMAVAAGLCSSSCGETPTDSSTAAVPVARPSDAPAQKEAALVPDEARLLRRVAERWEVITHDDWIQAYDYVPPERRKVEKISSFLQGKEHHAYSNPSKPKLVAIRGEKGHVEVEVVWTPHHPQILGADNIPPEGMTQLLSLVETWVVEGGEWYWSETTRRSEFYTRNPELAPQALGGAPQEGSAK